MRILLAVWLLSLAPVAAAVDAPFLWKIQSAKATHYLMGSVHLLPQSTYPLPPALNQAYADTRALMLETDPNALGTPQMQARMLSDGVSREGLAREIAPDLYQRVRRHAKASELPATLCDQFRAWMCALSLGVIEFQRAGMEAGFGLDQHFHQRATADRRAMKWLEAPETQLELFSGMSAPMAEQFLHSSIEDLQRPELRPEVLVKVWRSNDVAALEAVVDDTRKEFPDIHARLLGARNLAWMDALTNALQGATPQLVVVGAAHLVGDDGLISLLRGRGFTPQAVGSTPVTASR